jgi:hypothetical protein
MRQILIVGVMVLAVAGMAAAQDYSKIELYGGFSMFRMGGGDLDDSLPPTLNVISYKFFTRGGNVSGVYNLNERYGIEAGAQYNNGNLMQFFGNWPSATYPPGDATNGRIRYSSFSIAGGPHATLRRSEVVIPFAHVLAGVNHLRLKPSLFSAGVDKTSLLGVPFFTNNGFALIAGGGVDLKFRKNLAIRAAQIDYMRAFNKVGNTGVNLNQNNINISFGIVYYPSLFQ